MPSVIPIAFWVLVGVSNHGMPLPVQSNLTQSQCAAAQKFMSERAGTYTTYVCLPIRKDAP